MVALVRDSQIAAKLIEAVTAPLGFFVLALLIIESFLAAALLGGGFDASIQVTVLWMGVVLFVFVTLTDPLTASRTPAATHRSIICPPRHCFTFRFTSRVRLSTLSAALVVASERWSRLDNIPRSPIRTFPSCTFCAKAPVPFAGSQLRTRNPHCPSTSGLFCYGIP